MSNLDLSPEDREGLLHTSAQRFAERAFANTEFADLEADQEDGDIIAAVRWCLLVTLFLGMAAFTVWGSMQ